MVKIKVTDWGSIDDYKKELESFDENDKVGMFKRIYSLALNKDEKELDKKELFFENSTGSLFCFKHIDETEDIYKELWEDMKWKRRSLNVTEEAIEHKLFDRLFLVMFMEEDFIDDKREIYFKTPRIKGGKFVSMRPIEVLINESFKDGELSLAWSEIIEKELNKKDKDNERLEEICKLILKKYQECEYRCLKAFEMIESGETDGRLIMNVTNARKVEVNSVYSDYMLDNFLADPVYEEARI